MNMLRSVMLMLIMAAVSAGGLQSCAAIDLPETEKTLYTSANIWYKHRGKIHGPGIYPRGPVQAVFYREQPHGKEWGVPEAERPGEGPCQVREDQRGDEQGSGPDGLRISA